LFVALQHFIVSDDQCDRHFFAALRGTFAVVQCSSGASQDPRLSERKL
jgi:hypothetical protein